MAERKKAKEHLYNMTNPTPTSACKCGHIKICHGSKDGTSLLCSSPECDCAFFQPSDFAPAREGGRFCGDCLRTIYPPVPDDERGNCIVGTHHHLFKDEAPSPSPSIEEIVREFKKIFVNRCPEHFLPLYEGSGGTICCNGGDGDNIDFTKNAKRHVVYRTAKQALERGNKDCFLQIESFLREKLASIEKAGEEKGKREGYMEGHEEAVMEAASEVMKARQGVEDFRAAAIKAVEGMQDIYPVEIFSEPWEGWQGDVDELAKKHGKRIDNISGHFARWMQKVTMHDVREILKTLTP